MQYALEAAPILVAETGLLYQTQVLDPCLRLMHRTRASFLYDLDQKIASLNMR